MAKPKYLKRKEADDRFVKEVRGRIAHEGYRHKDIAAKAEISPGCFSTRLRDPEMLRVKDLRAIIETVGPDLQIVMDLITA